MKKFFLYLVAMAACLTTGAEEITEQQALQKAQLFMPGKQFGISAARSRNRQPQLKDTLMLGYYVFNTTNEDGFVIISSDDRMPEVLGYSEHGSLNPETAPANVKWLLTYYNKVATSISMNGNENKTKSIVKAAKPAIRPMITTTWDQDSPYNDFCPAYGGEHCLTGCVATAMAQVINYNRWPQGQTNAVEAYTSGSLSIKMPQLEPTSFNWDNMTNNDIARLMLYCGQAVKMDYRPDESGAFSTDEAPALINAFGYSQTAHLELHASYSDEDWEELLYNELAEQRPIIYHGNGSGGGHAFVIHGYADGRFYINWGWSGNEDGYFMLTGLDTNNGDFNSNQDATIGIQPPAGNSIDRPKVVVKDISSNKGKYTHRTADSGFGDVTINCTLVSDLSESASLIVGLGLYDDAGLKKVLAEEELSFPVGEEYHYNATIGIGSDFPLGTSRIVPISRTSKDSEWMTDANASSYYLEVNIEGEWMRLRSFPLNTEENGKEEVGITTIDGFAYSVYKQNGRNRAKLLYCESGKPKGDVNIPDDISFEGTIHKVYEVEEGLFRGCPDLTSLSIATTKAPAIENCHRLSKIELREGVISMREGIQSCSSLESITFPKSLSTIEHSVEWCEKLKTIRFNNPRVFTIYFYPHWEEGSLPALRDVYFCSADAPEFRFDVGEFIPIPNTTIHVPTGAVEAYEKARWKGWKIVDDQPLPDTNGIEWGYCDGDNVSEIWVYDESGDNDAEYAIHVPAEAMTAYLGKQISNIQFYQTEKLCDYVFITKPGSDYIVKQTSEGEAGSWVDIQLAEPYVITGEELFVGMGRKGTIAAQFSDMDMKAGDGLWYRVMGTDNSKDMIPGKWFNIASENEEFNHPIALRFIIKGGELPNDIAINEVTLTPAPQKGKYTVLMKVLNRSTESVNKFSLNWDIDGNSTNNKLIETNIRANQRQTLSFDIQPNLEGRRHQFNYSVANVNGQTDAVVSNSTGSIAFNAAPNTVYPRKIVMEEASGTWCGPCVRGIETINRLTTEYPDNFLSIVLHKNDEMNKIENYYDIRKRFLSYPNSLINRMTQIDPAYPKIRPIIEALKDSAEAKIEATALFALRDSSAVTVTSNTRFGFSDKNASNFRIAYAVVEDHTGPHNQKNGYSGSTLTDDESYMEDWTRKESWVLMEHNAVARGIYGGSNGIKGSVPDEVKENADYQYSYSFYLPETIQDKKNIRIIALLIDSISGTIVNAAQTTVIYNKELDEQTFELRNAGKALADNGTVEVFAKKQEDGEIGCKIDALSIATIDGKQKEGTAQIEIICNDIAPSILTWSIGERAESLIGKTSSQTTFKTGADGTIPISLNVSGLGNHGVIEAKLTVTIGNETHSQTIRMIYEKIIVNNVVLKDGEAWWNNHGSISNNGGSTGSELDERYHAAIHIPYNVLGNHASSIRGFCFRGTGLTDAVMTNTKVWIATTLPENGDDADLEIVSIPDTQIEMFGRWNSVAFEHEHKIPEGGLYVGYSFDIQDGVCPLDFEPESKREGGFWVKTDHSPRWADLTTRFGNLLAQVLLKVNTRFEDVSVESVHNSYSLCNGKAKTQIKLKNNSTYQVNNITIRVENERETYETDIETEMSPLSEDNRVTFELKGDSRAGTLEHTISIAKVNGSPNTSGNASSKCKLFTLEEKPLNIPVLEYITDLPGHNAYNWIAFNKLEKKFRDRVIIVNAHSSGITYLSEYTNIFNIQPHWGDICHINRYQTIFNPYTGSVGEPFGIIKDAEREMETVVPGSISVKTVWANDDKTKIDITAETHFEIDADDTPFQVGYVLLEDSMSGSGSEWVFYNELSGRRDLSAEFLNDPDSKEWIDLPEVVRGIKYDNIAVAAWEPYNGIGGSIPSSIQTGQTYTHTYQVNISGNTLIQNKDNLSIVALLLDKDFGTIINAAKCKIGGESPDLGINNVSIERINSRYWYNLDGTRMDTRPTRKGIYIKNGQKVIIK